MIYILILSAINLVITTAMLWLVADMFILGWDWARCSAIAALFIVIFGGVIGSMRDFKSLAERRLMFNLTALGVVLLAYMIRG